jgi:hypothetical protein
MTKTERDRVIERAVATAVHVAREGGVGEAVLPHPETRELVTMKIDQEGARELICKFIDDRVGDLWKQIGDGQPLSPTDRMVLRTWTSATLADSEVEECKRREESKRRPSLYLH